MKLAIFQNESDLEIKFEKTKQVPQHLINSKFAILYLIKN